MLTPVFGGRLDVDASFKGERTEETEKKKSELRLLRVGLLTGFFLYTG
jgi:hypothetical protein